MIFVLETLPKQNQNKNLILPELIQNISSKFAWMWCKNIKSCGQKKMVDTNFSRATTFAHFIFSIQAFCLLGLSFN